MSVTIRLSRIGKRNAPAYRIVVANTKDKRNGRPLDVLGHYNPSHTPELFEIDKKKFEKWKANGALVTDAVEKLVDGKYEFEPYTRQNEEKKRKPGERETEAEAENVEAETETETEEVAEETVEEPTEEATE